MSEGFTDGGGDPNTRHWFKDRQHFCHQTLSPYEMGLVDLPRPLSSNPDEVPRHPNDVPRWELPTCQEPVAPGYNPLQLCGCHLALFLEAKRKRADPTMKLGVKGAGLVLDFVEPKNAYHAMALAVAERDHELWQLEKASGIEAARLHLEALEQEALEAAENARLLRETLEARQAAAPPVETVEAPKEASCPPTTVEGATPPTAPKKRKKAAPKAKKEGQEVKPAKIKPLKAPEGPSRRRANVPEQKELF